MKNELFCKATTKATALVVSSLVVFSGQVLALSSNKEVTDASVLGNSKLVVAQNTAIVPDNERVALATAISKVASTIGNAIAITNAAAIPRTEKIAIARLLSQAITIIGNAKAKSESQAITNDDAAAIASSLSEAETIIGNLVASFQTGAPLPESRSLANAISAALTAAGNAVAVAEAIAA